MILEKNSPRRHRRHDADLFKIGDLSHLVVWAHLYEEDLPLVQALPRPIRWTVTLPARPRVVFHGISRPSLARSDPNQHTALVTGRVENAERTNSRWASL